VHGPVRRQRLAGSEDFFDEDVEALSLRLQPLEVLLRVVQAVRVVDAQAGNSPLFDQLERERVRRLEDLFVFLRQRGEVIDVEEPPVVDLVRRGPPLG
jgi:hypothetical protein